MEKKLDWFKFFLLFSSIMFIGIGIIFVLGGVYKGLLYLIPLWALTIIEWKYHLIYYLN